MLILLKDTSETTENVYLRLKEFFVLHVKDTDHDRFD